MKEMKKNLSISVSALVVICALTSCGKQAETSSKDKADSGSMTKTTDLQLPSLQAQLDAKRKGFEERAPKEVQTLYNTAVEDLRVSGILGTMRAVGDTAPDFILPSADGDSIRLSTLLKSGPVVLAWYRGGWCPYCNLELLALNDAMSHIESAGATLVAISPEIPDSAANTVAKDSLDYLVVSDVGNIVAKKFGIVFKLPDNIVESYSAHFDVTAYNGDKSYELPLPATYVINTDRTITYVFADADYRVRAEPTDIVKEVQKITSSGS